MREGLWVAVDCGGLLAVGSVGLVSFVGAGAEVWWLWAVGAVGWVGCGAVRTLGLGVVAGACLGGCCGGCGCVGLVWAVGLWVLWGLGVVGCGLGGCLKIRNAFSKSSVTEP